ncbi:MAG: porphobilinogen synthase [Dehalococcoidia bacterium]|nr:porphobilinogen synthase [Dehalococcoidia bacterium]
MAMFPTGRMRRLRQTANLRKMLRETMPSVDDFVFPVFVVPGKGIKKEISSMPGCFHHSVDTLTEELKEAASLGIRAAILFGLPESKDETGSGAYDEKGIIPTAVGAIKKAVPELTVITDVCLCEYTSHGHCGVVQGNTVDNDKTLELLSRAALVYAKAGADMIAPSDMMDGRVGSIRKTLDENGFSNLPIMSYAAKYASAFYGPFREAAQSAPQFGDRRSYQMDPPNWREAMREMEEDIEEGADIIMVKPALAYLDILQRARQAFSCPLAAYNVSGEYSMVKAAVKNGWLDEKQIVLEILTAIKRAGADIILTYHAKDAARWLKSSQ